MGVSVPAYRSKDGLLPLYRARKTHMPEVYGIRER